MISALKHGTLRDKFLFNRVKNFLNFIFNYNNFLLNLRLNLRCKLLLYNLFFFNNIFFNLLLLLLLHNRTIVHFISLPFFILIQFKLNSIFNIKLLIIFNKFLLHHYVFINLLLYFLNFLILLHLSMLF